jgi:hypothetical protein
MSPSGRGCAPSTGRWLFREASWPDMFAAFEAQGWDGEESRAFLRQWILEPGAPDLVLDQVEVRELGAEWEVDGTLRQRGAVDGLRVPVRLDTEGGPLEMTVPLDGSETHFTMAAAHRPRRLTADPDCHVFRLLAPSEIPPTVNSVKGAERLASSSAKNGPGSERPWRASCHLNQSGAKIVTEQEAEGRTSRSAPFFSVTPVAPGCRGSHARRGLRPRTRGGVFGRNEPPRSRQAGPIFVTMPDARAAAASRPFPGATGTGRGQGRGRARRVTHYAGSYLGSRAAATPARRMAPPAFTPDRGIGP